MPSARELLETIASLERWDYRMEAYVMHPDDWADFLNGNPHLADLYDGPFIHNPLGTYVAMVWGAHVVTSANVPLGHVVMVPELRSMAVPFGADWATSRLAGTARFAGETVAESAPFTNTPIREFSTPFIPLQVSNLIPPEPPIERPTLWEHLEDDD